MNLNDDKNIPENMKSLVETLKLKHKLEARTARLDCCSSCDRLVEGLNGGIPIKQFCAECGCYMPLKASLPWAKCPLGKWDN